MVLASANGFAKPVEDGYPAKGYLISQVLINLLNVKVGHDLAQVSIANVFTSVAKDFLSCRIDAQNHAILVDSNNALSKSAEHFPLLLFFFDEGEFRFVFGRNIEY